MSWKCTVCGREHNDLPTCFGIEAPWRGLVSESEFAQRVELSPDQCVIDGKTFFVRGHIQIPIHNSPETLAFSVWSSLSEKSFRHMCDRWETPNRAADPPYFGWLCSPISCYPNTIHLQLAVRSRAPGEVPLFELEPTNHPLSREQREGISIKRWHEIVHQLVDDL